MPLTLAEAWDGSSGSIQPTVNPAGFSGLSAVACRSAGACTAVGYRQDSSGKTQTLAEAEP